MRRTLFAAALGLAVIAAPSLAATTELSLLVIDGKSGETVVTKGRSVQRYPVFNRQIACKGNEAHRKLSITTQRVNWARVSVEAYNGGRSRCDVRLAVNNIYYMPITGLRPGETQRGYVSIPADTLQNTSGREILMVCYLDNFERSSWVSVDFEIDTMSGNSPYPGGGYTPGPGNGGHPYPGGGYTPGPGNGGHPYPGNNAPDADYFIRRAKAESTYSRGDSILISGSRAIDSLRGIIRLAAEAYSATTVKTICDAMADPNRRFIDSPTLEEIKRAYDAMSRYTSGDYMLVRLSSRLYQVRRIMFMSAMAYSSSNATEIVTSLDRLSRSMALEIPMIDEIRKAYNMFSSYSAGDRMLIKIAPFIGDFRALDQMSDMAYSSSTRRAIEEIRDHVYTPGPSYPGSGGNYGGSHGGSYNGGSNHGGYSGGSHGGSHSNHGHGRSAGLESVEKISDDSLDAAPATSEAVEEALSAPTPETMKSFEQEIASDNSEINLSVEDIDTLNTERISDFITRFKDNKVKKSYHLRKVLKTLKEKLTAESFQEENDQARTLLNNLMAK
ncbi:MAG: hypothetical protein CVV64_20490 [Candidatus Wallbacteria bacterium HGW-Wallbacteria-1]|jgi:hypothetical protein|uniref:Uncharacterized protein n=1 Tax=Candidatus Wallbacteria bacterium HGW-Wallbacteria-1 TaxID=2013854 RepID=A0A2N1PI89_9BACT|nr:MAG: hypothetical protein CVV64_20490 [Candidatus Wallbacteria bacterium HGW-Wallbacteria-1]